MDLKTELVDAIAPSIDEMVSGVITDAAIRTEIERRVASVLARQETVVHMHVHKMDGKPLRIICHGPVDECEAIGEKRLLVDGGIAAGKEGG